MNRLTSSTFIQVVVNTLGTYLNIAFAVFYTIFLARVFSKEEFGVLSVLLVISYVAANIFNFGMPATMYAHLPDLLNSDKKQAISFLKTNGRLLLILASISCFLLFLLTPIIDTYVLHLNASPYEYALALIGTLLYILQNFVRDAMNAAGKFFHINVALNISNIVKLIVLIAFYIFKILTISNTLIIMGIVGPICVFIYVLLHRPKLLGKLQSSKTEKLHLKINYSLQYFVASQLYMLAARMDLFMIAYFLLPADKGDYALSQRIVLAIVTSADSITQVLSPQFALKQTKETILHLLKKSFHYMLIPTLLLFLASITPSAIYNTLFTDKFATSIPITRLLALAYIPFNFASVLLLFFLYSIKKPSIVLGINLLLFVMLSLLNYVFVPQFQLFGAPLGSMLTFVVILGLTGIIFAKEYAKLPDNIQSQAKIGE